MSIKTRDKILDLLKLPSFKTFLSTRLLFIFAAQMQFMLISWKIYFMTKEVMYIGYLSLTELVPAFLLAFYGGYLVDKYNRKKILNLSLLAFFSGSLFLLISLYLIKQQSALIIIMMFLSFLSGIVRVFASPSQLAIYSEIVPKISHKLSMSWYSGVWQIAIVSAPLLLGLLYKNTSLFFCQSIICTCILTSLILSLNIRYKFTPIIKKVEENFLQSVSVGCKFVYNCKDLLGSFALDMFAVLFGGAVSLLPLFATEVFKVNTDGLGVLRSATPIGTILIIFFLSLVPLKKKQGYILLWTIFLFGICMILLGLNTNFLIAFFILFASGIFDGINVVIRSTILQIKTTDEVKGKVSAIGTLFVMSSNELGAFESSIATKFFGLQSAVVFGGSVTILVVILVYIFIPTLKKLEY